MSENIATTLQAPRRELVIFALVVAALLATMLALTDGLVLFTRPLWVDEWLTVLPATRHSPVDVLADLRAGADGGAGLLHLTVWGLRGVVGSLPPALLRALALVCVFAALCLTFVILRRRFTVDASAAGALAVGSNILVVTHAFEARFYGPWLLCCACFAHAMARRQHQPTRFNATAVVIASIALCTVHFYGIISLVAMCAGIIASYGRRWRHARDVVALPLVTGILAVLTVLPLALGQRSAYSKRTWIPEFELRQLTGLLEYFWLAGVPLIAAGALILAMLIASRRPLQPSAFQRASNALTDAGVVAMASLAVMPLALAIVSIAGQPSMLARYAITTALAWGPWVAWCMDTASRTTARVSRVVLAWFWFVSFTKVVSEKQAYANAVERNRATFASAERLRVPVLFSSIHVMYPVVAATQRASAEFLDVPDSTFSALFPADTERERLNRSAVIQRDLARVHARRFGFPRLASQASLAATPRFLIFAPPTDLPFGITTAEAFGRDLFPGHTVVAVHPDVVLVERRR